MIVYSVPPAKPGSAAPTISDANMAWALADAAYVCLAHDERTMMFVELGCGEHHLAIERILEAVIASGMALPETVLEGLAGWLDGYADSPEEQQLRTMLDEVRSHQCEQVPSRAEHAQRRQVWPTAWPAYDVGVAG